MDLITFNNGLAILNPDTARKVAEFEKAVKEIKENEGKLKERIAAEMKKKGVIKLATDDLTISYIEETTKETLDVKALREELPDIYDTYVKISPVKSSIRIKLK